MTSVQRLLEPFFAIALESFRRACEPGDRYQTFVFTLAGHPVRLQVAVPEMAALISPAFDHLVAHDPSARGLTIHAWDARRPEGLLPPPPWDLIGFFERGNLRRYSDDRFSLTYDRTSDTFSAVDVRQNVGLYWTRNASLLPQHELSAPMRHIFQMWLRSAAFILVHASAVGRTDGGLLLAGRGGSGKSTTAMLCLEAGLQFAGDDFVLASASPVPRVASLYNAAKLNGDAAKRLGELNGPRPHPPQAIPGKTLVYLNRVYPDRMAAGFPLRAVVLPRLSPQPDTSFERIASNLAYRTIVPDTILRTLGDAPFVMDAFRDLLTKVGCYQLTLGTDQSQIPRAVGRILDAAGP